MANNITTSSDSQLQTSGKAVGDGNASVTGKLCITVKTPMGEQTGVFVLEVNGGTFTGYLEKMQIELKSKIAQSKEKTLSGEVP